MIVKAYIHHKRAEKYSDCQDCFGINLQNNRIAISDGMSQSIFPQWWAKILVTDFLENGHISEDISPLQKKWQQKLINEIQRREEESITKPNRDPWRLKNLLAEKSGAGATLCGLALGDNEWNCECLGDSCVISINNDYTLNFYTSQIGKFGNQPDYFDSFGAGRGTPIKNTVSQEAMAILMVTDPFAELFQIYENNTDFIKARFQELQNLTTHESFTELVERWRDNFGMHNDDSTLILICDCADKNFKIDHMDDLDQLCKHEDDCLRVALTNPKKLKSNTLIESANDYTIEGPSPKEAFENFRSSFEDLLPYYTGKKSSGKITDWIKSMLKPLIDNHIKS